MALRPVLWNLLRSPSAPVPDLRPMGQLARQSKTGEMADELGQDRLQGHDWEIPVLYLRGTPYEMGWQHGHALKDSIQQLTEAFYQEFAQGAAHLFYRHLLPGRLFHLWKAVPQPYQEELLGVADGAELPLRDILLINFFDDVLNLLELGWAFACSTLMARGEGDRVLMGRNLDYNGSVGDLVRNFQAILVRQPNTGGTTAEMEPSVSVAVAGQIGVLTAMNQQGLSLGSMTSQTHEQNWDGIGVSLLYRLLIDRAHSVDAAVDLFNQHTPAQGNNLMLADGKRGVRIQFTSQRKQITPLDSSYLSIANHFVDEHLADTHTELYKKVTAIGSESRYQRLCSRADALSTPTDAGGIAEAITDNQLPEDFSRQLDDPWHSNAVVNNQGTLHSVVFDPQQKRLHVAIGLGKTAIQPQHFVTYDPFTQVEVSSTQLSA